ncbi:hypothetical protein BKA61DRAFT_584018 [Leptodontidium sp. MPI-SDFR-AT-0119]|nr:hypothetical protein BKA61DRAFT_584018 [Leptodontidium sp. MPI-SDFR-AT-0119]
MDPTLSYGSQQQGAASTAAPVYQNTPQFSLGRTSTLQENSRKRRTPSDSAELMKLPAKRTSSHQFGANEEYNTYKYAPGDRTPIFPQYLQPSNTYANLVPQQYDRSARSYQGHPSRHTGYGYSGPGTTPPPIIMAQSPQVTNWGSYPTVGSTTTLNGGQPGQYVNAYAPYPHKVKLEITRDVEAMALHWSEEESKSPRRLVHFSRSRSGSTITRTFQPVSPDDRPPKSVCISCIYWEEKQGCFVTSVDTIYLLEYLVAARFTVEEKNRIRRNLEGFRPLTVSKGKSDSEEFFRVIMAFPAPKQSIPLERFGISIEEDYWRIHTGAELATPFS